MRNIHITLNSNMPNPVEITLGEVDNFTAVNFSSASPTPLSISPVTFGARGVQGLQGEPGAKGEKGDTGSQGLQGERGLNGENGIDGLSAYEVAVDNGFSGDESEWLLSLVGPKGDTGERGIQGIQGIPGETGAQGTPGSNGINGEDGASAYDIAITNGFSGSEAEWLLSLKGLKGDKGDTGPQGVQGDPGVSGTNGIDGNDGASAYDIAVSNGYEGTQSQWLASLKGDDGAQGATGAAGLDGADGADGKSAYELAVDGGYSGTQAQWIASLKGEKGDAGVQGTQGAEGPAGADGQGVPIGGIANQVLQKIDGADFNTQWHTLSKSDIGLASVVNSDTTTTANISDSTDKRFVSDAQRAVLQNTSGTNTGDQTLPTDATISVSDIATNNASTSKHGWLLKATAPSSGLVNVVGIANGETVYSNKPLFDTSAPSTQAYGDSASTGSATVAARRDHKHAMPASTKDTTAISGILKGNGTVISAASAGTDYVYPGGALGTPSSGTLTNCTFPTLNQDTTGKSAKSDAINSATTAVNVSSASAPSAGQVLTATSSTSATWQTPTSGASVEIVRW